jgi:ankyrin repeat protein
MRGDQGSLNALVPSGPFPPAFGNPVTANPMQTALRNVQPLTRVIGGKLPLHYALNNNIDVNDVVKLHVVRLLVQTHPEGVRVPDEQGLLPLHIACQDWLSLQIVQLLVESHPDGARVPDIVGKLPLHYAALRSTHGLGIL